MIETAYVISQRRWKTVYKMNEPSNKCVVAREGGGEEGGREGLR